MSTAGQTPIAELERQARWEVEGTRRAALRYQEAAAVADPATLPPASKMLRMTVKPLIVGIEAAQKEGFEVIANGNTGRVPAWCWPIQLVQADKLAVIVATTAIRCALNTGRLGVSLAGQSAALTAAIRDQIEYDTWEAEQSAAKKEAKRRKDAEFEDLMSRLTRRYPNLDRRVWAKWRAKLALTRVEAWSEDTGVTLGTFLVDLLIRVCPEVYRMDKRPLGGAHYSLCLRLTPDAMEQMKDLEARAEVARPLLMPMVCPPLPWRYAA